MESEEVWKTCEGFRNSYEVSTLGRVRSMKYNNTNFPRDLCQNISKGYLQVCLDCTKTVKVHRLVAIAFLPNPDNYPTVDHINRNKQDNRLENLRWASRSMNNLNRELKPTNSGEHYVFLKPNGMYQLRIQRDNLQVYQTFKTLEEAVEAKNKYIPLV